MPLPLRKIHELVGYEFVTDNDNARDYSTVVEKASVSVIMDITYSYTVLPEYMTPDFRKFRFGTDPDLLCIGVQLHLQESCRISGLCLYS